MPRELYLTSMRPLSFETLLVAAASVDDQLAVRTLYEGGAWQLVDTDDVAVITVDPSRLLDATTDAARVTRGLIDAEAGAEYAWWTEATAPWGNGGDPGVRIAEALTRLLDGRLRVEDGR